MRIFLATDHAGFELKEQLKGWLIENGYEVIDKGAFQYDESDDYPDYICLAAQEVSRACHSRENGNLPAQAGPGEQVDTRAIILGGSGQGEAICANRFPGVRAAVYYGSNIKIVRLAREHNNANVLSLGARFVSLVEAKEAAELFLGTEFLSEDRHVRRIEKIEQFKHVKTALADCLNITARKGDPSRDEAEAITSTL